MKISTINVNLSINHKQLSEISVIVQGVTKRFEMYEIDTSSFFCFLKNVSTQ